MPTTIFPAPTQSIISSVHENVHKGIAYQVSHYFSAVTTADILVQVASTFFLHSAFTAAVTQTTQAFLYEGATFSAAGTALTARNLNRASSNTASPTLTHTPTITGTGTQLSTTLIPGGSGPHAIGAISSSSVRDTEWILNKSGVYLLRLTLASSGDASIGMLFYEAA